jgi:Flagellar regulator YcgR/PilZ domain
MQEFDQPADNARIITTRPDIVALLRGLSGNRSNALISFFNSSAHLSGKITQINPYFDEIIFSEEAGSDAKFPPGKASLITVLSSIKAQFHAERVEPTEFEGKPAWRVRIPKMMFCSERRESARIRPPAEAPLEMLFAESTGREPQTIVFPVLDIGVGGAAIMVNPLQLQVPLGKELKNCAVNLPNIGEVVFDLTIQNTTEISDAGDVVGRRCGCQFSKISLENMDRVKQYVEMHKG